MMKKCSKCKKEKDAFLFNKNKRKQSGYSTECKECVNNYNKVYRARLENKKIATEYNKIYRIEKAKKIAVTKEAYILRHEEEIRIIKKRHYENNKMAYKGRVAQYKKDNPSQYKEYEYRRRAAKNGSVVEYFSVQDILNMYSDHCFYCIAGAFEHLDHYIPLSKGGTHTLENVRPSCKKCNLSKNNKLPERWLREKKI